MAIERCRYTPDIRGGPKRGRICCWRPVYRDLDRCIWHAETGEKSVVELVHNRPYPGERLDCAQLAGLALNDVGWFADAVLVGADFSDANVDGADFGSADLRKASFERTSARGASFRRANLEKAELSSIDLREADLRMAKVDDSGMAGVRINSETKLGDRTVYDEQMEARDNPSRKGDALEAAVRTYRQYERLSQDNSLYSQASRFYRRSKDVRRRFNWEENNYLSALTAEVSRTFTGYGNKPGRVIMTAVAMMILSALVYPLVGGLYNPTDPGTVYAVTLGESTGAAAEAFLRSLFFSVLTFTTLGYGNLVPTTTVGRQMAGLEALLGSLVLALLVAVLTRSTWLR